MFVTTHVAIVITRYRVTPTTNLNLTILVNNSRICGIVDARRYILIVHNILSQVRQTPSRDDNPIHSNVVR